LTLKEEIHKVISDHFYDIVPVDDCTNDILKLFEKEIDSLKKQLDSKNDTMMISSLNFVKEMLLK
jgi:hypothetical protein